MCVVIRAGKGGPIHTFGICHLALFFLVYLCSFVFLVSRNLRGKVSHVRRVSSRSFLWQTLLLNSDSKADTRGLLVVSDHSANWVISSHKSSFFRAAGEAGTITASEEEKLRNDCRTALSCPPGKPNTTHYKIGRNRTNCPLRDLPKQMWGFIRGKHAAFKLRRFNPRPREQHRVLSARMIPLLRFRLPPGEKCPNLGEYTIKCQLHFILNVRGEARGGEGRGVPPWQQG